MSKKRFTSPDFSVSEEEMPSLSSSPESSRLSDYEEDDSSYFQDEPIVQRRHTDALDRSNISSSSNAPPRQRSRSRSRPRKPSSRSSRSRSKSRGRFSYSRRSSLGGTTIYRTPHMATLDTHLRSTSGLRLQTDGTCNFLFEDQRFVIETTEETGDFLFYASLGMLKDLQRAKGQKHLLRLLAFWNEELKQRGGAATGGGEGQGLLRIDSSKLDGPHVAFIYYGHIGEIKNAQHLQDKIDEFVDDALDFSDKLNGVNEQKHVETASPQVVKSQMPEPFPSSSRESNGRSNFDREDTNHTRQPSSSHSEFDGRSKFNREAMNQTKQPIQEEAATLAAPTNNNTADTSTSKKSVFTKMISSLKRSKSNDNIGSLAFVDPSNSVCAFVVDKNSADEGKIKPTINLSRKGVEKREDIGGSDHNRNQQHRSSTPTRKGASFNNRTPDNKRYPEKGRSFHVGDDYGADYKFSRRPQRKVGDDYGNSHNNGTPHAGHSKPNHRSTSFTADDYSGRNHHGRQSTSFHVDNNNGRQRNIRNKSSTSLYNLGERHGPNNNNNYPTSKANSKSFTDRNRSSNVFEESDAYDKSIVIYEQQSRSKDARFLQTEPAGVSRRRHVNDDYPEPTTSTRSQSRRHSSAVSQHSRRKKNTDSHRRKRHSIHDERSTSKSSHHSSRHHNTDGRMNQSEPVLSHQQKFPPPPPFR